MTVLSKRAMQNKRKYNLKRNKELTKLFQVRLSNQEYNDLCEYLQIIGMNKAEFLRWSFDKLREENQ